MSMSKQLTKTGSMERIRAAGELALAEKKEIAELADRIAGLEWSSGKSAVKGSNLTPQTRMALAEFCRVTKANPIRHVEILGGSPYLNADYWAERINSHERFLHYEQDDLSPSVEQGYRDRAKRQKELAARFAEAGKTEKELELMEKALEYDDQADEIQRRRQEWSPRPNATVVIETRIYRLVNSAPLKAIKAGEITDLEPYTVVVREANWAGGMGSSMANQKKWDPIGDANPGTTARSRSLRRAAVKAFPAWMEEADERMSRAEQIIEAEWEEIVDDEVPGSVVNTSTGEIGRGAPGEVYGVPDEGEEAQVVDNVQDPEQPEPEFDRNDARKALFATFNAVGLSDDDARKAWSEENGYPRSTKDWTPEQFDGAVKKMISPIRQEVARLVKQLDVDPEDLALQVLEKHTPEYAKDWMALRDHLRAEVAEDEGGEL